MLILHTYSTADTASASYVAELMRQAPEGVEMRSVCGVANAPPTISALREARDTLHPDIIHQHGMTLDEGLRLPQGGLAPRLVISPHGTLPFLSDAYAVIARSPLEAERLKGMHKHIETIRNPLLTRTTSGKEWAAAVCRIYRKVLDSDTLPLMTAATRSLLAMALKAAICGDKRWVETVPKDNPFPQPSEEQFRCLYIYASEQGVLPLLKQGLRLLDIAYSAIPQFFNSPIPYECYRPEGFTTPKPKTSAPIPVLLADIKKSGASLLRLTELTAALYDDTLDEAALMAKLKKDGTDTLLRSLLPQLASQTLLTEGFIPIED